MNRLFVAVALITVVLAACSKKEEIAAPANVPAAAAPATAAAPGAAPVAGAPVPAVPASAVAAPATEAPAPAAVQSTGDKKQ